MTVLQQAYMECIETGLSIIRATSDGIEIVNLQDIYDDFSKKTHEQILKELKEHINLVNKYKKLIKDANLH